MRAAQGGRREVVAALLDKGASVNAREEDGTTALDMAEMFAGHAVVALLNDHGAKHGKDLGALPPKTQARPTADATVCPEPVFAAAKKGQAAAVNKDLGCDPGAKDASGTTPLHWAVVADKPQMIGALVNRSARIDAVDGQNLTPLALAVLLDRRQVAEQILAHGAGVDAAWKVPDTLYSNTPLTLVAYGLKDQFEYLGFSREMTPLHLAAKLGRIELARMLLDRHANLKAQSLPLGLTPLHVAADGGPLELIKLLLDRGADVNAQDGLKQTPLFNAAGSGDVDAVKLLLARGANVHARGEGFGTALNLVLELHNENAAEVVGVLLQHRADPNSRGQSEATPLHQVAFGQDAKIAKLLLERGADPKLKDADGRTPLDLAKLAKNQPLEDLLSKAAGP
jgi:ankyrin repeat protein